MALSKISLIYIVLAIAFSASFTEARDHIVGGKPGAWNVPSDADFFNKWASKSRFQIGDNLVWKYDSKKDSVLEVTRDAYLACNITSPISELKNDETKVVLNNAGPHYFISGVKENCDKGEKVLVVVISPRARRSGGVAAPSLAPAPAPDSGADVPAVAPTSGACGVKAGLGLIGVLVGFLVLV